MLKQTEIQNSVSEFFKQRNQRLIDGTHIYKSIPSVSVGGYFTATNKDAKEIIDQIPVGLNETEEKLWLISYLGSIGVKM